MKAENYRIGNLVLAVGEVRKIDSLSIRQRPDCGYFGFDGLRPLKGIHIKPIPLTEEWLLKLGGKKCSGLRWYEFLTIGIDSDAVNICMDEFRVSIDWIEDEIILSTNKCKHVHQLQNLYFALTGEELTITG